MTKTFARTECMLCGQVISSNGLSQTSHAKMHVREGYLALDRLGRYVKTSKSFDRDAYQKAHPERAYNNDDYFPITGHPKDAKLRKAHVESYVARKLASTDNADDDAKQ